MSYFIWFSLFGMPEHVGCKLCICFLVNGQGVEHSLNLRFGDALLSLHVRAGGC